MSASSSMASTRQRGERMRIEAYKELVAKVTATPSLIDRFCLIEEAVDEAVNLGEKSKSTFRGECTRVTDPRVLPIFADALNFSEQVIRERAERNPKMPTVQHVLLDVCKRIIETNRKSPRQALSDLQSAYQGCRTYPC